jgi:hypothetical protein
VSNIPRSTAPLSGRVGPEGANLALHRWDQLYIQRKLRYRGHSLSLSVFTRRHCTGWIGGTAGRGWLQAWLLRACYWDLDASVGDNVELVNSGAFRRLTYLRTSLFLASSLCSRGCRARWLQVRLIQAVCCTSQTKPGGDTLCEGSQNLLVSVLVGGAGHYPAALGAAAGVWSVGNVSAGCFPRNVWC